MITNDMFIENDTYLDQHKNRISIITGQTWPVNPPT